MSSGIFMLFGKHNMRIINTLKSFSRTFHMPFVTTGPPVNTTGQRHGYELYLRPMYSRAIVEVMKFYRWKDVWYIYDSDEGKWMRGWGWGWVGGGGGGGGGV